MIKNRNNDPSSQQHSRKSPIKPFNQKRATKYRPEMARNQEQKQNAVARLQYLRKKYSSKQKDDNIKAFEHTKNYMQAEQYKPKEEVREQSKSYIRETYRDINKGIPKEEARQHQREYSKVRAPLEGRVEMIQKVDRLQRVERVKSSLLKQQLNNYKQISTADQQSQNANLDQNKSTSNFKLSNINTSLPHSTSVYKGSRQIRDKSCQKVSQRVENITKINEKIKSLLNVMETSISIPLDQISKPSFYVSRIRPQSSLKGKKAAYIESHIKLPEKNIPVVESIKQNTEQIISSNQEILKHLSSLQVQNYESQHIIDDSFVAAKQISKSKPKTNQIQTLMYKLSIQIEHDENLRTSKYFLLLSTVPDKYQKLQHQLSLKGVDYSLQKLKDTMKFTEEEYNPFIYQTAHQDFGKFADAIIASNEYWQKSVYKKFDYKKLKSEKIDRILVFENKEEELGVSDLVRFVNLGSGNLYKNRDLVLVARRMSQNENQLSINKIFQALCDGM